MAIFTKKSVKATPVNYDDLGGILVVGDFKPPDIVYKDADEVTVPVGFYPAAGHRLKGQYQNVGPIDTFWEVNSAVDVDVDAAGTLIGGKSTGGTGSWYSLFMTSASTFLVLPFVRVDAISESGGVTTINPAAHDDGTTADNTFVTGDDDFNDYRLMYLSYDTNDGTIWTISDTVNGTPDQIKVASDITAIVSAADWLQMLPPAATDCLYLGTIRVDNSGNLLAFDRYGRFGVQYRVQVVVDAVLGTSPGNTDLGAAVPPIARRIVGDIWVSHNVNGLRQIGCYVYSGSSGTNLLLQRRYYFAENTVNDASFISGIDCAMSSVSLLRNYCYANAGSNVAADSANFRIRAWEE